MNTAAFAKWIAVFAAGVALTSSATTTIDSADRYTYGANLGWMDARGNTNNGVVVGEYVCSGYMYSANVGWINFGNGTPANQIQYQNNSSSDFGVNVDSFGNLRGYAYAANVGWLNFENLGAPAVDLFTGKMSGSAWSANCGWISLSNSVALVKTVSIQQGALAPNGLPIAWLLQNFSTTNIVASDDADHDGQSNAEEYLAGTDPNNAASVLKITALTHGIPTATYTTLSWNAVNSRYYAVQECSSLTTGTWNDFLNFSIPGWNNAGFDDLNATNEFFRIRAYRPLMP